MNYLPEAMDTQADQSLLTWVVQPDPVSTHKELFVNMLEIYLEWAKTVPEISGADEPAE